VILMLDFGWSSWSNRLAGQISPGPLAKPHAELEGTLKCTRCHTGGKEAMSANCLACHKDLGWLAERNRGYHATREVKGQSCSTCHPDHAGASFDLIKWPDGSRERFDHRRAGWPLLQSHAEQKCADCHNPRFRTSPAARLTPSAGAGEFIGLETSCSSCHTDVHRGNLGTDCTKCHDAGKWQHTPGFNHDSTSYPLTRKHIQVECEKCHLNPAIATKHDVAGRLIPVFSPVPHQSCADCHKDPHAGRLGPTCTGCHSTAGFKQIDRANFDHERTRYPLKGEHASVRCVDCHQDFSTPALKKPPFQACSSCHRDVHNGTATLAGRTVDCAECHSLNGFAEGTLTVERHRQTRYALAGKHQTVRCGACHRKETNPALAARLGESKVVIRPAFARCLDCHADDHGGQLAARTDKGECASCHTEAGWTPSRFDAAQHASLKLPLEGRHRDLRCRDCHGIDRKGLPAMTRTASTGKAGFVFKLTETDCAACHIDPHQGRFARRTAKVFGCAACHDARGFRPSTIDVALHREYRFPLEGAHRATPCLACHRELKAAPIPRSSLIAVRSSYPVLAFSAPVTCGECHQNPHGTQFAGRKDAGACESCHGADAFQPASRFDHNRDAAFSLKGAHQDVPCNRCHPTDTGSNDPKRLIYRPVSGKCENCHAGKETR
jgi:cytochrome c7-like protein/class III cytochrome C family protein